MITLTIMIKITRMIRYLLLQFVNIASGDLSAKFSGAFKISLAVTPIFFMLPKTASAGQGLAQAEWNRDLIMHGF